MNLLRPYQYKGVDHLLSMPFGKPHALLADSPGTGKTPMSIEAAKKAHCQNGLVVCPAIIKQQWARQSLKWGLCAEDEIQTVYGTDAIIGSAPWVYVNYDLIRVPRIREQLAARKWHCIILDEAHRTKTHDSQQTKALFHKDYGICKNAYYKWALSGSIMPNRPIELYPLLKTMAEDVIRPFNNYQDYMLRYCGGVPGKGATNIEELTERLQPFMLRRELKDVWAECPPIIDNEVWLDVPYQLHPEWLGDGFMWEPTMRRVVAESKTPYIVEYVADRLQSGVDKLAVFCFHRSVIDALSKGLAKYNPAKIYGGMTPFQREQSLVKFTGDATCRLFLLQISSAGEGVDGLQEVCAELVLAEPEWSPGREDQAIDRIRRLGQTRPVILTKLLANDSYEERIEEANRRKRKVINVVLKPNGGSIDMSFTDTALKIFSLIERGVVALERMAAINNAVQSFAPPATPMPQPQALPQAPAVPQVPAVPQALPQVPPVPLQAAAPVGAPVAPQPPTPPQPAAPPAQPINAVREAFERSVVDAFKPFGNAGFAKLTELLKQFNADKLSALPEEHFANFQAHVAYNVSQMPPVA